MKNKSEFINIDIDSGVCTVTMNRLDKKNAINPQFALELCSAWDVIDNENEIRPPYQKNNVILEFKDGLYQQIVMASEVGSIKKEIIYSSDVLNITSRVQE